MAKKMEKLGRGRKRCPECGTIVAARATTCPNCQYAFLKRGRRAAVRKATGEEEIISRVVEFVKQHGGIDNSAKILEDVTNLVKNAGSLDRVHECFKLVSLIRENL